MLPQYTISDYIEELKEQFYSGQAKEHAYRPALKRLMGSYDDTTAVNDPKRSEHGNPDFIFIKASNQKIIRGYAEAKDIDVSLDKTEKTNQMERYHGYANLFLTDYLEFRFFKNGDKYKTISLGHVQGGTLKLTPENADELARELKAFLELPPERIKSGRRLAEIMGGKARRIRDNVDFYLNHKDDTKNQELERIYEMMKSLLVHDLSREKFADMYAQTLVYGLFVARYGDDTPDTFTRAEARDLVPKSNPFLRHFFDHIVGPNFDIRLGYIVDELCEVFSVSDVQQIVHKHLKITDESQDEKDPIIHFYEDFLNEYDPSERKKMGAYYTPTPVVKFIVREVDRILKEDFGISKGLASEEVIEKEVDTGQDLRQDLRKKKITTIKKQFQRVQILDPAVGTATFLNETIKFIHQGFKGQEGRWPAYVRDSLVNRLYGFELMMAPYTIAHLKLGMTLKETGVSNLGDRLGVYLTNTLEEGVPNQGDLFSFGLAQAVSDESRHAAEVKSERPVVVVMGNPPYSVESSNKTNYASSLIDRYRVEPGGVQKLQERNSKVINDDYVKFIAFAERMIEKNGEGVVAMITNHGFLDNPTFRGMRWHLTETFDKIYLLDLHGNSKKQETAPDGSKDENVFDIMQGVSIILAVKNSNTKKRADIFTADIYGKRKHKFSVLNKGEISWNKIETDDRFYMFKERDIAGEDAYRQLTPINSLFILNAAGIKTSRDAFVVDIDKDALSKRIHDFSINDLSDDEIKEKYSLKEAAGWKISKARNDLGSFNPEKVIRVGYRPFDVRWTYWDASVNSRMREKIMDNLRKDNLCLATCRQQSTFDFQHAFIYQDPIDMCSVSLQTRETGYAFPLYIYHEDGSRTPNLNQDVVKEFTEHLTKSFEPEDILDYIYGILYSRKYRTEYSAYLKVDFPRVPKPESDNDFNQLKVLGKKLRQLHLMEGSAIGDYETTFSVNGGNEVEKVQYKEREVWINDNQYFGNVPEVAWNFHIGGYQPAQKWLKDRKERVLSNQEIDHYQKIVKILIETDKLMSEIDKYEIV